jgi:hypothetical protein
MSSALTIDLVLIAAIGAGGYYVVTHLGSVSKAAFDSAAEGLKSLGINSPNDVPGTGTSSVNGLKNLWGLIRGKGTWDPIKGYRPKTTATYIDSTGAATSYDDYIKRFTDSASQSDWVNSRGTFKQQTEAQWYASHPNQKFENDIHSQTGYYGKAAEDVIHEYFGTKYNK